MAEGNGKVEYGRLLERVDTLCDRVDRLCDDATEIRREHERRLRALEKWRNWLSGSIAALFALFGIRLH